MTMVAQWDAVHRRYGELVAVEDVSLVLQAGEVTALVGHNGAGKTTLIKLLLGAIRPDAGSVRVAGFDPAGSRGAEARRTIGFLPESVAFHGAMTAIELMAFYARLKGAPVRDNPALLERVGIAHAARRRVGTYSKGMRQRLGIAQALIGAPRLLLFDEPTSGLDPASRSDVYRTIDALRAGGATVLVSTHALAEVQDRVDRVAIVHRGRLLTAGTLPELRRRAAAEARIRLRVQAGAGDRVLALLPAAAHCIERGATELTVQTSQDGKMPVLRALAGAGELVEDIETDTPGLQQLYDRLIAGEQVEA